MPLSRKTQVAAAQEAVPGTAVTLTSAHVIDTIESSSSRSRSLIDRASGSGTLTRGKRGVGRSEGEITCPVELRGSGTVTTAPDWGPLVEASYMEQIDVQSLALTGTLSVALEPGDIITEAAGDFATAVVMRAAAAGASSILVYPLSGTWSISQAFDSAVKGASVGTTAASGPLTAGQAVGWKPVSSKTSTFDITGAWSASDPAVGEGIKVVNAGTVTGEAIHLGTSGTDVTVEWIWGTIGDGYSLTSTTGKTATAATPTNFTGVQAPTLTAQHVRDNKRVKLTNARTTFGIEINAGETGRVNFTLTGQAATPDESQPISGAAAITTTAPSFGGGLMTVEGVKFPVKSFRFDQAGTIVNRADGNSANGTAGGEFTDRAPTITVEIEQTTTAALNLFTAHDNGTLLHVGLQIGTTSGNTITVGAPEAQVSEITDGDQDGIATYAVTFVLTGSGSGDNEFYIGHV